MTQEFNAAVDNYIEVYEALSEDLKAYLDKWEDLDGDYFKWVSYVLVYSF